MHSPLSSAYFITGAYVRSILRDFSAARAALDAVVVAGPREQLIDVQAAVVRAEIEFREEHYDEARYAAIMAGRAGRAELSARILGVCDALENPSSLETSPLAKNPAMAALRGALSDDRIKTLRAGGAAENLFDRIEEFLAN
jgi:hypothetical protein